MKNGSLLLMALLIAAPVATFASENSDAPYAGFETRSIKALSDDEIAGLREGSGMSLALAAELNGHPGPLHVLELADKLSLNAGQRARTQAVFDAMKAKAAALGAEIVALEARLDAGFRAGAPGAAEVERLSTEIGRLRGILRAAHLTAHLEMNDILSADQRARYAALRGYGGGQDAHGGHRGHAH